MEEKISTKIPIVEHLPTADQPHPNLDNLPEGSVGHPGEHLDHEPMMDSGKVIGAPHPGYGQEVKIRKETKNDVARADSWLSRLRRHGRIK